MKHLVATSLVFMIAVVSALAVLPTQTAFAGDCGGQTSIFPRWYDDLCVDSATQKDANGQPKKEIMSPNDFNKNGTTAEDTASGLSMWLGVIAMNIVKILLTVVAYVSLAFVIYGGFKFMVSGDSSAGITAARKIIQNALIGLVISIMSVAIIGLIAGAVVG